MRTISRRYVKNEITTVQVQRSSETVIPLLTPTNNKQIMPCHHVVLYGYRTRRISRVMNHEFVVFLEVQNRLRVSDTEYISILHHLVFRTISLKSRPQSADTIRVDYVGGQLMIQVRAYSIISAPRYRKCTYGVEVVQHFVHTAYTFRIVEALC